LPRPDDLPDFTAPPINEVVIGVQFTPAIGYQQVMVGEVWALFRKDFPSVQEEPPLPPTFETFGLPQGVRGAQINLRSMPEHSRYWFISPSEDELLQFQKDRLLHNWRKVGDKTNEYPRFETLIEKFEKELQTLEAYFASLAPQSLKINQCEVTYTNHIEIENSASVASVQDWLNFVRFDKLQPDDFVMTLRKVVSNPEGKPLGRLIYEAGLGLTENNEALVQLALTFRGAPAGTNIKAAIDFLQDGRRLIVQSFKEITTDMAHQKWGMVL
jgi:uncharacterized protein (TIGR04255 family)